MFLQVYVILFTGGRGSGPGGCLVETPGRLLLQVVRILLECILVDIKLQWIFLFLSSDRKKPGKSFNRVELKRDSRRTLATIRKVVRGNRYRKDLKMVRGRYHQL